MKDYETITKKGAVERRVYIDSGKFVIYGYESEGGLSNKIRLVLNGKEKKSFFLIETGKKKRLAINAAFEDEISILKDGKPIRVADLWL
ncbi:MAG: hypothetical protein QXU18_16165 [Thermoplasmatales archaeon]